MGNHVLSTLYKTYEIRIHVILIMFLLEYEVYIKLQKEQSLGAN